MYGYGSKGYGSGTRNLQQPTAQATVMTSGKPDHGSIESSRKVYGASYFYHTSSGLALPDEFFSIKQNEVAFIVKNPFAAQQPKFRTCLNGVDFDPIERDIIKTIEEKLVTFDEPTRNDLVREIISRKIQPVGIIKGDGVTYREGHKGAKKVHDKFMVDSAGTVPMKVRSENLGLGMMAEIKIPTRMEWEKNDEFSKSSGSMGRISLFADPLENRTMYDRMSEIFWKFNPFEHPELAELVKKAQKTQKTECHLPTSVKMVFSFVSLMKTISVLALQKGVSAGIISLGLPQDVFPTEEIVFGDTMDRNNTINAGLRLRANFGVAASHQNELERIYDSIKGERAGNSYGIPPTFPNPSLAELQIPNDKILNSNRHCRLFNPRGAFENVNLSTPNSTIFGGHGKRSRFEASLDVLSVAFTLSKIARSDYSKLGGTRGSLESDSYLSLMDAPTRARYAQIFANGYNEMYHTLIHDFLPPMERLFFNLGNTEKNGEPVLNTKVMTEVYSGDQNARSTTHVQENFGRDFGRVNHHFHEAFGDVLHSLISYFENINDGYRITVVEPADHKQAANIYVRQ